MREEITFARDMTFHLARRKYGSNIPATDIDFLEYDHKQPVLLWEAKSTKSGWRDGIRTASMEAQWNLACHAGIPYRVVEHNKDWSELSVCTIAKWEGKKPIIETEIAMSLFEFVSWLYEIRGRNIKSELGGNLLLKRKNWRNEIPDKLNPQQFKLQTKE